MNKTQLKKFKKLIETQRIEISGSGRIIREEFAVSADDRMDEVDHAAADQHLSMVMRDGNRRFLLAKKLDQALKRIEEGTFGECQECGDDIETKRLEARPTATLCVGCKEEQEKREVLTAHGRLHKSLGETFSRKYA